MQFLSGLTGGRTSGTPPFEREASAGSRLPYAHHVNDRVLRLRDGTLMLTIRLGGLLFETAESDELNYRKTLRDAMLRAIGSSRYAVYHHIDRRRVELGQPLEHHRHGRVQIAQQLRGLLCVVGGVCYLAQRHAHGQRHERLGGGQGVRLPDQLARLRIVSRHGGARCRPREIARRHYQPEAADRGSVRGQPSLAAAARRA